MLPHPGERTAEPNNTDASVNLQALNEMARLPLCASMTVGFCWLASRDPENNLTGLHSTAKPLGFQKLHPGRGAKHREQ